ncbi:MAG: hypothetical protein AB7N76_35600 [Planctomycetota bacterium]
MAKQDEFDVLTFFIYVMGLLTLIVGGFALLNRSKLKKESVKLSGAVRALSDMETMALDDHLKEWIARERTNKRQGGQGTTTEFHALCVSKAAELGLRDNLNGRVTYNGTREDMRTRTKEATFRLELKELRVEPLVKLLVALEENWPGARVKRILKLDYSEKRELWDTSLEVAIYNPSDS